MVNRHFRIDFSKMTEDDEMGFIENSFTVFI